MTNEQKINVLSCLIGNSPEEWQEENTTGNDVLVSAKKWLMSLVDEEYPVIDDIWPSRRWKSDKSDCIDLSGY